jgi:hypothetical protein
MRLFRQKDEEVDKEFEQVDLRLRALEKATGVTGIDYVESKDVETSLNTASTSNRQWVDVSDWTDASVQATTSGSPANVNVKASNTKEDEFTHPDGAIQLSSYPDFQGSIDVRSFKYLVFEPATGTAGTVDLNVHLRKVTP